MNNLVKVFVLLAFGLFFSQSYSATPPVDDTVVIKTAIYCNHCLKCESCKGKFDELLDEKGIVDVSLDVQNMTITVVYMAKKTNPKAIRTAISNLGYDADDVPANPAAVEKLDGCCLKSE